MFTFSVGEKTYKVRFGYGALRKEDLIDRISTLTDFTEKDNGKVQEVFGLLSELLLVGLQKYHKDTYGYDTPEEKAQALEKIDDLLDDYEDDGTEENPKNGYILFDALQKELVSNGFLSGLTNRAAEDVAEEKNATKLPQDHKGK